MKIGIDASILATTFECGLKRYQKNLICNLAKIDKRNQYYIFSPGKIDVPKQDNFRLVILPNLLPVFKRQIVIPLLSFIYKIDIFHFPDVWGSIIPPCGKTIVTLQDLAPSSSYPKLVVAPKYYISMLLNRFIKKFTLKHASKIIVPSKFIKAEYIRSCGSDSRVEVINNGLSSEFTRLKQPQGFVARNHFLAFSDFSPRKNIGRVLLAYKYYLNNSKKGIRLIVVASTSYPKKRILDRAKVLGIKNGVKVVVGVPTNTLVKLYNQSIGLIYPSLYEGFGLPIIEAMACGCPVITSNYGSMKEISGDAALFVNPRSPKLIAKKMLDLESNYVLRNSLVQKGLKRAKNFSWINHSKKVLSQYEKLQVKNI